MAKVVKNGPISHVEFSTFGKSCDIYSKDVQTGSILTWNRVKDDCLLSVYWLFKTFKFLDFERPSRLFSDSVFGQRGIMVCRRAVLEDATSN